jgi:hypothetical protein
MNDEDMLAAMRNSLSASLAGVHMTQPASAITARARRRVLRRGATGFGAVALAAGLGLALVPGGQAAGHPVHANLAAWSVNTTPSGIVDVTVRELKDPALLRATLAAAGVQALVTFNEVCYPKSGGGLPQIQQVLGHQDTSREIVLTINPAAMPAGTELTIGMMRAGGGITFTAFALIKDGTALTCGPGLTHPAGTPSAPSPTSFGSPAGD